MRLVAEALRRIDLRVDPDADLSAVGEHLKRGGVVAYPTETVYGLGSLPSEQGIRNLRDLKGRTDEKPFILLVESAEAVQELDWTEEARELASVFWPGAVTLVLSDPRGFFPEGAHGTDSSVAVRRSPQVAVARLIAEVGGPITSTSANIGGSTPARSGSEVMELLRRCGRTDVIVLDAGTLPESAPSTIIDCTTHPPTVLREGSVPVGRLRCAIPEIHE